MCFIVFVTLSFITVKVLIDGPLSDYIGKVGTYFVESYENIEDLGGPIKWPDISICPNPKDKDKAKFEQFLNKGTLLVN